MSPRLVGPGHGDLENPGEVMVWVPCGCGNYWCFLHGVHAHECECPDIEGWEVSPYTTTVEAFQQ